MGSSVKPSETRKLDPRSVETSSIGSSFLKLCSQIAKDAFNAIGRLPHLGRLKEDPEGWVACLLQNEKLDIYCCKSKLIHRSNS